MKTQLRLALFILLGSPGAFAEALLQPAGISCEGIANPLGIESASPRLSWTFIMNGLNQRQTGYEIIVSADSSSAANGKGTQWSSGKITSPDNTAIQYQGAPLASFMRYYWRVRVYDANGERSEWSPLAWFETAMLSSSDWAARWIGDGSRQFARDEDFYKDDAMPLFRKSFSVARKVQRARLYISGVGYYEAYLNGKKIGDHELDPGWTTYQKEVLYVVHDLTNLLKSGANVAGIMLGNGWYNPLPLRLFSRFNLREAQQTGRSCVKAEIHIRYADGTAEKITTDETWQTAPGPVVRNNIYLGEKYDARLEQGNWCSNSFKPEGWRSAAFSAGPSGKLTAQLQPPVRITKIIKPIRITEPSSGVFIVDMGQNFAGVAKISVTGKSGTKISIRYGEALNPDGTLNYLTSVAGQLKEIAKANGGPGAPRTAWQQDDYILNGKGVEQWHPRFTFHGFRFLEIKGWPGKPDLNSIEGLRMNSDLIQAGEFSCSNSMFNQVHDAAQWTFLSNVFSVQSDCPGREKFGYGADMVVAADSYLFNYDMQNFYSKSVRDFANEQRADGGITETAPFVGIADKGYGNNSGPLGWQLAFPFLQEQLFLFYGDRNIIAENYPAVQKQLDFLKHHAIDGLYHWDISDHMALDPRPEALSAAAFYYHHAILAAEFAGILNKKDDSLRYAGLATEIKGHIIQKYWIPKTGRFDNGTQSAQLFALWYGLTPEPELSRDILLQEFERHGNHVSSGIFGLRMMFDYLRKQNMSERAYAIANQRDFPGWGYMMAKGATTLWEDWEYSDNIYSQNHPMFGSIEEWFYRSLLGINPEAPGFGRISIRPQPAGDLTWAKGSYQSVKGKIDSDWSIRDGKYSLRTVIPPNTKATVWIRCKPGGVVTNEGITLRGVQYRDGYAVVDVGSGEYHFSANYP